VTWEGVVERGRGGLGSVGRLDWLSNLLLGLLVLVCLLMWALLLGRVLDWRLECGTEALVLAYACVYCQYFTLEGLLES